MFLSKESGFHKDHIVGERSCDCEYFLFSTIYKEKDVCVHIKTFIIASRREDFVKLYVSDLDFKEILTEIFAYGKSLKLRKLLSLRE
ncbi:metal-binding protein [Metallosphaera tengchongensis]|uniref:Metal-binding protein n=1 Tax=Metallosphaera tengchongensis TaxID=1532350 RepID=A0A6N0P083_9CREN|nr:metal-binding protein [Metallosphaera tengchongensis]